MGFKPVLDIVGTQNRFPSTKYDAGSVVLVGSFVAREMCSPGVASFAAQCGWRTFGRKPQQGRYQAGMDPNKKYQ